MDNIIIISGATATGKSRLAIQMAAQHSGEIINADIGSFYKPMTIGTAKPDWKNEKTPHHLFDIIDKPVSLSVTRFRERVIELCEQIWARGNTPIIVGGSVFYIRALFYRQHDIPGTEPFVARLESSDRSSIDLWKDLEAIDELRASQIDPHDRYRVIRALAIFQATGKKPSVFTQIFDPIAQFKFIICDRDRDELYDRIDRRVVQMLDEGWLEEAQAMRGTEWEKFLHRKKMIGYDDLLAHLANPDSKLDQMVATIQKRTRNYAKRQVTFLKKLEQGLNAEYDYKVVKRFDMNQVALY